MATPLWSRPSAHTLHLQQRSTLNRIKTCRGHKIRLDEAAMRLQLARNATIENIRNFYAGKSL